MKDSHKRAIKIAIKVLITVLAYAYVAYKIATSPDIDKFPSYFSDISNTQTIILIGILLLMPINWLIESWKWQRLIRNIEQSIGLGKSIKAVMAGVTVGTLTPNRAGEFAGRILFVSPEKRTEASYLTIFGDIGQFCATIIFGIAGLLMIGTSGNEAISFGTLMTIVAIGGILVIALFIKFDRIVTALGKTKLVQNRLKKYVPQCDICMRLKFSTLALSMLRYIVFAFQFYLSLKFFGIDIPASEAFAAISATYICTYLIPGIAAAELGIRTSFAIAFIGIFTTQETAIALASLLLYIVNVGIPIAIGGIFMLNKKN
jgi:Predicted integral membrane protein